MMSGQGTCDVQDIGAESNCEQLSNGETQARLGLGRISPDIPRQVRVQLQSLFIDLRDMRRSIGLGLRLLWLLPLLAASG